MNIALVPARCGSKSIKFKNIKLLNGKPLIYWVLKALSDSEVIDKVFVATDCKKIADVVISLNLEKVSIYNRLAENARDESSTESLMIEFLTKMEANAQDNLFLVQATSPMLQSSDITKAYKHYIETGADSLLTCSRVKRFFWNEDATPINYDFKNRPRRQDFIGSLVENGALYINKVSNILNFNNRLSGKITIYEMPEYSNIDIDEEDDWVIAEKLMKKHILME